jgi:hypothetical protein
MGVAAVWRERRARAMRSPASLTQEIFFQTTELQVEQITRHLKQTYNYIDANGRVAVFDTLLEGFVGPAGRAVELPKAPGVGTQVSIR